jgi:carboxymethylenebutenolidase
MKHALIIAMGLTLIGCGQADDPVVDVPAGTTPNASAPGADSAPAQATISQIPPAVAVITEEVAYGEGDDQNLRGYMVLPADAVDVPGIIMIHERWGLNDYVRAMARRLAGEGYAVLAVDLYGGQTTTRAADAERLMGAVMRDREATLQNIRQAYRYLDEFVLAPRIAVIGWALGGGWALEAGLEMGEDIDAVVMFYGDIITIPELLENLQAPLFGVFAGEDASIPAREVVLFRGRLQGLGKPVRVEIFPGQGHAFANPDSSAYNHDEAVRAWDETLSFLDEQLR